MRNLLSLIFITFTTILILGCLEPTIPEPPIDICNNNINDPGEEGVDCGGPCEACFPVDVDKEVLITDLAVVNSDQAKTGDLSFGQLLMNMADDDSHFKEIVLSLFSSWESDQTINEFIIPARPIVKNQIISQWKTNQGIDPATPNEDWTPNPMNAPFRLLAITNRVDLTSLAENKAGEGRLTFGQDDEGGNDFTIIFEYRLSGSDSTSVISWAKKWHQLSRLDLGSPEYMDTLTSIVSSFTQSGEDLSQLRTNSVIGGPWEFREFIWNSTDKRLVETTRKQNPDVSLNGSPVLSDYLSDPGVMAELINGLHSVPSIFNSQRILSGNTFYGNNFTWTASGIDPEVLGVMNFISCTGCHGGMTPGGIGFTHIKPRSEGAVSDISNFLFVDVESNRKTNINNILSLPISLSVIESFSTTPDLENIKILLEKMKDIPRVH